VLDCITVVPRRGRCPNSVDTFMIRLRIVMFKLNCLYLNTNARGTKKRQINFYLLVFYL
jgi:hypothetical protein